MAKRVTIKDIASKLNVSYGIINKALNNKSGISDEMREKILATADELGYRVNKVAQSMARAPIVIGVIIPEAWQEYYSYLRKGIDKEFDRLLDYNVQNQYYVIKNAHSAQDTIKALRQCIEDEVHAVILCDVHPVGLEKVVEDLEKKEIPIALVGDALTLDTKKLCSVLVDAYRSGKIAAEMLHYMTYDDADVIIFVGNKDNSEHKLKIQGFVDGAKEYNLNLVGVYETNDDEVVAAQLLKKIISECDMLHGIYSATSNSISLCKMIDENGYNTKIISTDINENIAKYIKKGIIQCSIFQDLEKHGRTVVRSVYEYLTEHKIPEKNIYISPQIILKSNIDTFYTSKEDNN